MRLNDYGKFEKDVPIQFSVTQEIILDILDRKVAQWDVYKTWTTPWTRSMDQEHGPPLNFQKEIAPVNTKIYRRSWYENTDAYFFSSI